MSENKYAYIPTPHQWADSKAIYDFERALVWADPGTGKTLTAIMAADQCGFSRIVVVCPPIAMDMWADELKLHLGLKVYIMRSGALPKKVPLFTYDAIVVTYGLIGRNKTVQRVIEKYAKGYAEFRSTEPERQMPSCLILDEAHYACKLTAALTRGLMGSEVGMMWRRGMERHFTDVWQLTGTPITRYPDDLFAQLKVARPELLQHYKVHTYAAFRDKFCVTQWKQYHPKAPKQKVVVGAKNTDLLNRLLKEAGVIRRKLVDVVDDLPPVTYRTISVSYSNVDHVPIPSDPLTLIRELNKPDSQMSKLRRQLGIAKVGDTVDYVMDVHKGPMLLGFYHIDVGESLYSALEDNGLVIAYIDGSTPHGERKEIQERFNNNQIDILLGQVKAMGVSANLQHACNHVVVAEEVMSPSILEQFVARVVRRGQKSHVQVDLIRSNHDLDDAMVGLRLRKADIIEKVV